MAAWLIRAGKSGEREIWALEKGKSGGGFGEVGDLTGASSREGVASAVTAAYPVQKDTANRNFTAQLWALCGRMAVGDTVVMPLKASPHIAIGKVTSDYHYLTAEADPARRHVRAIDWRRVDLPRSAVKQDLLYSLGAFSTICGISRNDAVHRLDDLMLTGADPGARTVPREGSTASRATAKEMILDGDDDALEPTTVGIDIGRFAADQIASRVIELFSGHRLTDLVAAVLEVGGFVCDVAPPGPDQGIDIVAGTGLLGLGAPRMIVQVKSESTPVGSPVVQQLQGAMSVHGATEGLLVAWGGVTKPARDLLSAKRFSIKVWDSDEMIAQLLRSYSQLPDLLRADLPLRQIWIVGAEAG